MAEIELKKRVVYAGDVHIALLKAGWGIKEAVNFVKGLPDVDVAPARHELQKAVKLLEANYERGLNSDYVRDPVAWALYQTWKEIDGGADNGE